MAYQVEEFNPANSVLILNNKEIVLSLITLQKEVIFKQRYGSLEKLFEKLKEKPEEIVNVIWELVLDKKQFKSNLEVFQGEIFSITSKDSLSLVAGRMNTALNDIVVKSMPLIKNKKRYEDIQKLKGATENEKPCYVTYFDTVSKRYGYTIEKFYGMTLRQLHMLLNTIGDETYKELEVQAALQGRQLKPRIKFDDISEEEDKANEAEALEALKRLQENYEKKQKEKEGK